MCAHQYEARLASFAKCKIQLGKSLTQIGLAKLGFLYDDSRQAAVCQSCSFSSDLSPQTTLQSVTGEHLKHCPTCPQHFIDGNAQLPPIPDLDANGAVNEPSSRLAARLDNTIQNDHILDNTPENFDESSISSKQGRNGRNVECRPTPTVNAEGRPGRPNPHSSHRDIPRPSVPNPIDSHRQRVDDSVHLATQSLSHDGGPELPGVQGAEGVAHLLGAKSKKSGNTLRVKPKLHQNNNAADAGDVAQRDSSVERAELGQERGTGHRYSTQVPSRWDSEPLPAARGSPRLDPRPRLAVQIPLRQDTEPGPAAEGPSRLDPGPRLATQLLGIRIKQEMRDRDLEQLQHQECYNQVTIRPRSRISPDVTINDSERWLGVQNRSQHHTPEHGENSYQNAPHCIYYTGTEINLGESPD